MPELSDRLYHQRTRNRIKETHVVSGPVAEGGDRRSCQSGGRLAARQRALASLRR
jgi:hypothetical protein